MNIRINNYNEKTYLPKFLEGGTVPADAEPVDNGQMAPAPELGGSPEELLLMACLQALQSNDCELALQVCSAILQMAGGGAAGPQAPEGQAPVYKKGGKLARWQKK